MTISAVDTLPPRPYRHKRTPVTEAIDTIGGLFELWGEILAEDLFDGDEMTPAGTRFATEVWGPLWSDPNSSGDVLQDEAAELFASSDAAEFASNAPLIYLRIACAYCAEAMRFHAASTRSGVPANDAQQCAIVAWTCVRDAAYYKGVAEALYETAGAARSVLSKLGSRAAHARHREHRDMKDQLFSWCDENLSNYPSAIAAAEEAKKLIPVKFLTVRDWILEYKKHRSAGGAE